MMSNRKLLFIAYFAPPVNKSASRRTAKLVKYLSRLGWRITLLTASVPPQMSASELDQGLLDDISGAEAVVRVTDRLQDMRIQIVSQEEAIAAAPKRRGAYRTAKGSIKSFLRRYVFFPDEHFLWLRKASAVGLELCAKERYDALLSTHGPASAHAVAFRIHKRLEVPWVVDYRDPWSENEYRPQGGVTKLLSARLERKVLEAASRVTGVSEGIVSILRAKTEAEKVCLLTNGYDEEDFPAGQAITCEKLTFMYAGNVQKSERGEALASVLRALGALAREEKLDLQRIELKYLGGDGAYVAELAGRAGVGNIINNLGYRPFEDVKRAMVGSHVLLMLQKVNEAAGAYYPGKIFEYMGARRPILIVGGKNMGVRSLFQGNDRVWCVAAEDAAEVEGALAGILAAYHQGRLAEPVLDAGYQQYSYARIAARLSGFLGGAEAG